MKASCNFPPGSCGRQLAGRRLHKLNVGGLSRNSRHEYSKSTGCGPDDLSNPQHCQPASRCRVILCHEVHCVRRGRHFPGWSRKRQRGARWQSRGISDAFRKAVFHVKPGAASAHTRHIRPRGEAWHSRCETVTMVSLAPANATKLPRKYGWTSFQSRRPSPLRTRDKRGPSGAAFRQSPRAGLVSDGETVSARTRWLTLPCSFSRGQSKLSLATAVHVKLTHGRVDARDGSPSLCSFSRRGARCPPCQRVHVKLTQEHGSKLRSPASAAPTRAAIVA